MKKENLAGNAASNIHSIQAKREAKEELVNIDEQRLDEASLWITKIDRKLSKKEQLSLSKWLTDSAKM